MIEESAEVPAAAAADEEPPVDVKPAQSTKLDMAEIRKVSTKQMGRRPTHTSEDRVIIDRTALEAILDVSSRIQTIQKKSKVSMSTLALGHETYKDKQVNKFYHLINK